MVFCIPVAYQELKPYAHRLNVFMPNWIVLSGNVPCYLIKNKIGQHLLSIDALYRLSYIIITTSCSYSSRPSVIIRPDTNVCHNSQIETCKSRSIRGGGKLIVFACSIYNTHSYFCSRKTLNPYVGLLCATMADNDGAPVIRACSTCVAGSSTCISK